MLGGGGVDGAIHAAAGRELKRLCREHPALEGERCPTGTARLTRAAALPVSWVVHTVGPVYDEQPAEESGQLLAAAYRCAPWRLHNSC